MTASDAEKLSDEELIAQMSYVYCPKLHYTQPLLNRPLYLT